MADLRILPGDCLHVLADLPANSIDSCVTDPPLRNGLLHRECPQCGNIYLAREHRLRHRRDWYCSRECSYLGRMLPAAVLTLTCPVCGRVYDRPAAKRRPRHGVKVCSTECVYRARRLGLIPRVVETPYARHKNKRSAEASAKQVATRKANGTYRHTEETKRRLAAATAKAIAEGRVARVSRLEDNVADVLVECGVPYRRQVGVRNAGGRFEGVADFWLSDPEAVVEVNGTFWHADPRIYPDGPVSCSQIRNAERWAKKMIAYQRVGVPVIVVWEADIREHGPGRAVFEAAKAAGVEMPRMLMLCSR